MAAVAVHLTLVAAVIGLMSGPADSLPPSAPNYETKIACEGNQLQLSCEEGTKINLIRANFGRFSISICNTQGNLEWSVNCMARRSFRVIQEVCGNRSDCLLFASAAYFGDPCPGVNKYLEVHYQCLPESNMKPAATERRTIAKSFNPQKPQRKQPVLLSGVRTDSASEPAAAGRGVPISGHNLSNNQSNNNNNDPASVQPTSTSSPIRVITTAAPVVEKMLPGETASAPSSTTPPSAAVQVATSESVSSSALPPAGSNQQEQLGAPSNSNSNNMRFSDNDNALDHVAGSRDALQPSLSQHTNTNPPFPDEDEYEGTSSSLDTVDRTALPLSEHLRLLLTIGCVFGVICLFLTMLSLVLTATAGPSHHPQHHVAAHQHHHHHSKSLRLELQVKQNLTLCLLLVQVLFLIGINLSQSRFFCGIVSGTLHYFFLSIFIWLFFDGFTLYLALLKQQEDDVTASVPSSSVISSCASKSKPCRCYLVLAYGLPLLIQVVSSLLDTGSLLISSSPTHCWLRSDKYFVLTFVGPVIAVLSANFLFLAITVVCSNYGSLFNFDKNTPFPTAAALASESSLRRRLRTSLAVFVVMSLALTALFVSLCQELPEDEVVFTSCLYVFAILNPVQVLVIVVLFSSSSSVARSNSVKVLTSLGFLSDSKSNEHPMHGSRFSHKDGMLVASAASQHSVNHEVNHPEPMIPMPLPHASTLSLADAEREGSVQSKAYTASDYGFRRNMTALNYRSPVYGSSAAAARVRSGHGHVHTKQCLQFPCQYPHVVEHVYESIDEDPYIARLLMPIPTPLIGRKAHPDNVSANAATVLPAIIRDNTNHSTIICSSSLTAVRASSIKSHLVNNQCQTVPQQQHQPQSDQSTAAKLRQESTLI